jgi:hypothetical protein
MPNKWITFVREWSNKNNMSYGCALSKPECSAEYRRKNPKKLTKKQQRERENKENEMMGMEDFDIKLKKKTKSKKKEKLILVEEPKSVSVPKQKKGKEKYPFIVRPLKPNTNLNNNEKQVLEEYFRWWDNNPYFKEAKKGNYSFTKNHYYSIIFSKLLKLISKYNIRNNTDYIISKFIHPDDLIKLNKGRTKGSVELDKDLPVYYYDDPELLKKMEEQTQKNKIYQPYRTVIQK